MEAIQILFWMWQTVSSNVRKVRYISLLPYALLVFYTKGDLEPAQESLFHACCLLTLENFIQLCRMPFPCTNKNNNSISQKLKRRRNTTQALILMNPPQIHLSRDVYMHGCVYTRIILGWLNLNARYKISFHVVLKIHLYYYLASKFHLTASPPLMLFTSISFASSPPFYFFLLCKAGHFRMNCPLIVPWIAFLNCPDPTVIFIGRFQLLVPLHYWIYNIYLKEERITKEDQAIMAPCIALEIASSVFKGGYNKKPIRNHSPLIIPHLIKAGLASRIL